jgi:hypothetical protein
MLLMISVYRIHQTPIVEADKQPTSSLALDCLTYAATKKVSFGSPFYA